MLQAAVLPCQIQQQEKKEAGSSSVFSPHFLGGFFMCQQIWSTGRQAGEAGAPAKRCHKSGLTLLGISLPCRAALAVSCPPLAPGVLKSPSSSSPPAPPYCSPSRPCKQPGPPLPAGASKSPHCESSPPSPAKPCNKIIHELTKLKMKQALCGSDPTPGHAELWPGSTPALVAASPPCVIPEQLFA